MRDIPFSPPDITDKEINEVIKTLKSGWITTGPKVKEFEKKISSYCGTKESICMNSATACMEMALRLLEIGPGDEVIVPSYTYTATCSVVCHVGATPVMIDCAPNSYEMDYEKVYYSISAKTKAIIPVDLGGILCDYEKIFQIVNSKKSLFNPKNKIQEKIGRVCIISDSAHSFGATRNGKVNGSISDFTSFSFHAVKNLTTGEGGALTWTLEDENFYNRLSILSLHGQTKNALSKINSSNWEYDIVFPGFKNNMTDILASIGIAQLDRFDELIQKRRNLAKIYNRLLKNEKVKIYQTDDLINNSTVHLYIVNLIDKNEKYRNLLIKKMLENGIHTNVHYKPLPMMTAYKNIGFDIKNFPNSYNMYKNEITLPLHTLMTESDVEYMCEVFHKEINNI